MNLSYSKGIELLPELTRLVAKDDWLALHDRDAVDLIVTVLTRDTIGLLDATEATQSSVPIQLSHLRSSNHHLITQVAPLDNANLFVT